MLEALSEKLRARDGTKVDDTEEDVELSLWDFAGQELYYVTHQVISLTICVHVGLR